MSETHTEQAAAAHGDHGDSTICLKARPWMRSSADSAWEHSHDPVRVGMLVCLLVSIPAF